MACHHACMRRRTSQPGGFVTLLFCASCTTARMSASDCKGPAREGQEVCKAPQLTTCCYPQRISLSGILARPKLTHLAACRRHAHVVIHFLNSWRQILHIPWMVLNLVNGDALGRVCIIHRAGP
jgi:hypothetical protein